MPELRPLLELVTPPTGVLITTAEARRHCVIDDTDQDDILDAAVKAATAYLEAENGILGRALFTQQWKVSFPCIPSEAVVELPFPPIQSIDSVTYIDADGEEQTFDAANYSMHQSRSKNYIALNPSASWPSVSGHFPFRVTFTVGYVDTAQAAALPPELIHAGKLLVSHFFENREATTDLALRELPFGISMLLAPFRVADAVIA